MRNPQKSPGPGSLVANGNRALQTTNVHSINPERIHCNSLLGVIGCHWDASLPDRRTMYLCAVQSDISPAALTNLAFADFDHASQVALLGAVVLRCPEMFRHFVAEGFL